MTGLYRETEENIYQNNRVTVRVNECTTVRWCCLNFGILVFRILETKEREVPFTNDCERNLKLWRSENECDKKDGPHGKESGPVLF